MIKAEKVVSKDFDDCGTKRTMYLNFTHEELEYLLWAGIKKQDWYEGQKSENSWCGWLVTCLLETPGTPPKQIGSYYVRQFPSCCGVLIENSIELVEKYQNKLYTEVYRELRKEFARKFGYSATINVDIVEYEEDEPLDWNDSEGVARGHHSNTFQNKRSKNFLEIGWDIL